MSEQDYYPTDPVVENLKAELVSLKTDLGNLIGTTRQAQQAEIQELGRKLTASEREFVRTTPDYEMAASGWKGKRMDEIRASLRASGQPEKLAEQILAGDIARLAARAEISGRDPAEVAYEVFEQSGHRSVHLDGPRSEVGEVLKELRK